METEAAGYGDRNAAVEVAVVAQQPQEVAAPTEGAVVGGHATAMTLPRQDLAENQRRSGRDGLFGRSGRLGARGRLVRVAAQGRQNGQGEDGMQSGRKTIGRTTHGLPRRKTDGGRTPLGNMAPDPLGS